MHQISGVERTMFVKVYQYHIQKDKVNEFFAIQEKAAKVYGKFLDFHTMYLNSREDETKWIEITRYKDEAEYKRSLAVINEQEEIQELFAAFQSLLVSEKKEINDEDFIVGKEIVKAGFSEGNKVQATAQPGINYYIRNEISNQSVELWSTKRLPFEPKGWLKDMRDSLKKELKKLKPGQDKILYSSYHSASNESGYDIENILFYNVGSSVFSHMRLTEICFEKGPAQIEDSPIKLQAPVTSYSLYKVVPREELTTFWRKDKVLAVWENVQLTSLKDAYSFWSAMRLGPVTTLEGIPPEEYGLELTLHLSHHQKFSLPSDSMKKLLDGVICAFHRHNGENLGEVAGRLAEKLPFSRNELIEMLRDRSTNVLGDRSVFNLYRENSLICNPADDLCVFVKITILPTKGSVTQLSGQLFSVKSESQSN